jgi:hypothetical protein
MHLGSLLTNCGFFLFQDVIDLRENKWQPRRAVEGPKTIGQIHQAAREEELRNDFAARLHVSQSGGIPAQQTPTVTIKQRGSASGSPATPSPTPVAATKSTSPGSPSSSSKKSKGKVTSPTSGAHPVGVSGVPAAENASGPTGPLVQSLEEYEGIVLGMVQEFYCSLEEDDTVSSLCNVNIPEAEASRYIAQLVFLLMNDSLEKGPKDRDGVKRLLSELFKRKYVTGPTFYQG